MRSTGEVMGIADTFARAFGKSLLGVGLRACPSAGAAFISVQDDDKPRGLPRRAPAPEPRLRDRRDAAARPRRSSARASRSSASTRCVEGSPHVVDAIRGGDDSARDQHDAGRQGDSRQLLDPPQRAARRTSRTSRRWRRRSRRSTRSKSTRCCGARRRTSEACRSGTRRRRRERERGRVRARGRGASGVRGAPLVAIRSRRVLGDCSPAECAGRRCVPGCACAPGGPHSRAAPGEGPDQNDRDYRNAGGGQPVEHPKLQVQITAPVRASR